MLNRRHQHVQDNEDGTVTIGGPCIFTGEFFSVTVPAEQYDRYSRGAFVQDAFSDQSPDVREFIMSGISPAGWQQTFGGPEDEEAALQATLAERSDEDAEYEMDTAKDTHPATELMQVLGFAAPTLPVEKTEEEQERDNRRMDELAEEYEAGCGP